MSPVCNRLHGRELTKDTFFHGQVLVYQPRRGWRFSLDAPVLADFITPLAAHDLTLEVGSGCGVISLLLLWKQRLMQIVAYEVQPFYARLCVLNSRMNGFSERLHVRAKDFTDDNEKLAGVRLLFANPPYYRLGSGRLSPHPEIRLAKWEERLSVESLLGAAKEILAPDGQVAMILPAEREGEFRQMFTSLGFYLQRYRAVCPFAGGKAARFLVQLSSEPSRPMILPPLILYSRPGVYSAEMICVLKGSDYV